MPYIKDRREETKSCRLLASAVIALCNPDERAGCIKSLNKLKYTSSLPGGVTSINPYMLARALFSLDNSSDNQLKIVVVHVGETYRDNAEGGMKLVVFANGSDAKLKIYSTENNTVGYRVERNLQRLQGQALLHTEELRKRKEAGLLSMFSKSLGL